MLEKLIKQNFIYRKIMAKISNSLYIGFILLFSLSGCQVFYPHRATTNQFNSKEMPANVNVALALSGGGVRSAAQLGVIDVLEKNGIDIDLIVGTSGGSIVGALYADSQNAFEVKEKLKDHTREKLLDISVTSLLSGFYKLTGSASDHKLEDLINENLSTKQIQNLKIPFVAVATDVGSGSTVGFRSGNVFNALRASSAVPGVFSPVLLNNMILVDGSVTDPIPINTTKQFYPKIIIAVDVASLGTGTPKTTLGLTMESLTLSLERLRSLQGAEADILIQPELENAGFFAHSLTEELFQKGQQAAIRQLPLIKQSIKQQMNFNQSQVKPAKKPTK